MDGGDDGDGGGGGGGSGGVDDKWTKKLRTKFHICTSALNLSP
jgi:hypothetical protein